MDMKLWDQVAKGAHVELVAAERLHHPGAEPARLVEQRGAVGRAELEDLAHPRDPRHQDHPGVAAVIEQQDARQAQLADRMTVRRELPMEDEIRHLSQPMNPVSATVSVTGPQDDNAHSTTRPRNIG